MKKSVRAVTTGALFALMVALGGCSDDYGTPCNFPSSPEIEAFCGNVTDEAGNPSTSTCVDPINPDCESRLCVIYQGNDAFCSQRCSSDGGCPGGSTCQFPLGSSLGVCVPNKYIDTAQPGE